MTDQRVVDLILDKIDALGESLSAQIGGINDRLDKVNGRLGKHDDQLADVQQRGCARFAGLHEAEQDSKAKAVSQQAGLIGVVSVTVVGLLELIKALVGKL
jgi:hypothetical protein